MIPSRERETVVVVSMSAATCGVYWAPSTIPNSGMGLFAAQNISYGHVLQKDIVIPIVDLVLHNKYAERFLFEDYWWSGKALGTFQEGVHDAPGAAMGFGAASNAYLPLTNVAELFPFHDNSGLHRAYNPGAGASSTYHGRRAVAQANITSGQELFVDYGSGYFRHRPHLNRVPMREDHDTAQKFLEAYHAFEDDVGFFVAQEIWDTFVVESPFSSRVFGALDGIQPALLRDQTLTENRRENSRVDEEYLLTRGVCADNLVADNSTIPEAGKGAFARRFIPKGSVVAPFPLLHVPYRNILDMFELDDYSRILHDQTEVKVRFKDGPSRQQLFLNYCMGHSESTLLLCPYGPIVSYINHNKTRANVRLQWAKPHRSHQNNELLNKTVEELKEVKYAQLAFELVALEDLQPKTEIFLDYGDEWEEAWIQHTKLWRMQAKDKRYVSALVMNQNLEKHLKTEFEALESPYPDNVELKCFPFFMNRKSWEAAWKEGTLDDRISRLPYKNLYDCDILSYRTEGGERLYSTVFFSKEFPKTEPKMRRDLPKQAFKFIEKPYTADWALKSAFRHAMGVPDELFPETWRNLRVLQG